MPDKNAEFIFLIVGLLSPLGNGSSLFRADLGVSRTLQADLRRFDKAWAVAAIVDSIVVDHAVNVSRFIIVGFRLYPVTVRIVQFVIALRI